MGETMKQSWRNSFRPVKQSLLEMQAATSAGRTGGQFKMSVTERNLMSSYSSRVTALEPSATVRIGELADKLRADGADIVDLSQGDPDFVTPDHARDQAKQSLDDGETHYTASTGIERLRKAIAEKLRTDNDLPTDADRIAVTPGGKQALFEVLFALLDEGDEVVLLEPSWVSYEAIVTMCGGRVRQVGLDPATDFGLGDANLEAAVTDETTAILINTPSNPTGAVFDQANLQRIRDLAVDHDTWVVADEIYEKLVYDAEHVSIGSLDGMSERTVTVNGFSKSYAMTGWRLGYYDAPSALFEQATKVQSHTVTCATSFAQRGAVAALEGPQEPVAEMRETYRSRRDAAVKRLSEHGLNVTPPDGAFYLYLPVTADDDVALSERLLTEENVATTPGTAFGVGGHIRLAYTTPTDRLLEGIDRIAEYLVAA
jgi:aspartate aminotransferase